MIFDKTKDTYRKQLYQLTNAAFDVRKNFGLYNDVFAIKAAFAAELKERNITFIQDYELRPKYKGVKTASFVSADFICYEDIVVKIIASEKANRTDRNQLKACMDAADSNYGLLFNFNDADFQVNVEKAKRNSFSGNIYFRAYTGLFDKRDNNKN